MKTIFSHSSDPYILLIKTHIYSFPFAIFNKQIYNIASKIITESSIICEIILKKQIWSFPHLRPIEVVIHKLNICSPENKKFSYIQCGLLLKHSFTTNFTESDMTLWKNHITINTIDSSLLLTSKIFHFDFQKIVRDIIQKKMRWQK